MPTPTPWPAPKPPLYPTAKPMAASPAAVVAAPVAAPLRPAIAFIEISHIVLQNPHATPAQYAKLYLDMAHLIAANCRAMNACGAIVWDESCDTAVPWIDGRGNKTTPPAYTGTPQLQHQSFAPVAKQFFDIIRTEGGCDVGVTLRWQMLAHDYWGNTVFTTPDSYGWSLWSKAQWAHDHYGATMFYCDSNVDDYGTLDVRPLYALQSLPFWKDAHFFWEHVDQADDGTGWKGWGRADYGNVGGGGGADGVHGWRWIDSRFTNPIPTPDDGFLHLIGGGFIPPAGWDVTVQGDYIDQSRFDEFVAAAKRGDKLLFGSWVPVARGSFAEFVQHVCAAAAK